MMRLARKCRGVCLPRIDTRFGMLGAGAGATYLPKAQWAFHGAVWMRFGMGEREKPFGISCHPKRGGRGWGLKKGPTIYMPIMYGSCAKGGKCLPEEGHVFSSVFVVMTSKWLLQGEGLHCPTALSHLRSASEPSRDGDRPDSRRVYWRTLGGSTLAT
jgi:hypothetical protein